MASIVKNEETEGCLRELLVTEGYQLSKERCWGETGVDIIAKRGGENIHIEVMGYKSSGPARAKDFFQGFFRAVSRVKDGATVCALAMPVNAKQGLPARASQYGEAWTRIGNAFPELEIWLVDIDQRTYEKSIWNQWAVL